MYRRLSQEDRARHAEAAQRYWADSQKVETIGREMGISRSTVSRMLARARQERIIEFIVHRDEDSAGALRQDVQLRYGVQASVPPVEDGASQAMRRLAVGDDAASWLLALVRPGCAITVSWGRTVEAMSARLRRRPVEGVRVVQLHGSGNVTDIGENYAGEVLGRFGAAFGARVQLLPVPAVFDTPQAREVMWRESSVYSVLAMRNSADVLVASIGTSAGPVHSRLYDSGYIGAEDLEDLDREEVVGNIGSTFFRADGSEEGIELNRRTTGMSLEQVRAVPQRLLLVAEPRKARALDAALRAGLATHVVLDPLTAKALLAL